MKTPVFIHLVFLVLFSSITLFAGLYLLAKFNRLFKRSIRNEWLRKNVTVWVISICLIVAIAPTGVDFWGAFLNNRVFSYYLVDCIAITLEVFFVFNVSWLVVKYLDRKEISFRKKMAIILCSIIVTTMFMALPVNYLGNAFKNNKNPLENVEITILFNFYTGCMAGLIYVTMSFVDLDRKKKLNEKELEVLKLQELKTKAELDVLHSKINPHFLYNALNSIADLSITDGKKARRMTIALADLFRYSINYSNNNYSTIKEEIEMTEVYLAIEKIRFEDQLTYSIKVDDNANQYLVPRFILQPVVENAVKHGLKATGKLTEIGIEVSNGNSGLQIDITDNGPEFPQELIPGYGVKSIFDKLDLLFPGNYEIHFVNQPQKKVSIKIFKLTKNEAL